MGNLERAASDAVDSSLHHPTQSSIAPSNEIQQASRDAPPFDQAPNLDLVAAMSNGLPRLKTGYPTMDARWDRDSTKPLYLT